MKKRRKEDGDEEEREEERRDGEEDEEREGREKEKEDEEMREQEGKKGGEKQCHRPADPIHGPSGSSHPPHHLPRAGGKHQEEEELSTRPKPRVLEEGRDPCPCFLGQHRKHSHRVWPPCPRGAGDSLYLEPVPCSQTTSFLPGGIEAHPGPQYHTARPRDAFCFYSINAAIYTRKKK